MMGVGYNWSCCWLSRSYKDPQTIQADARIQVHSLKTGRRAPLLKTSTQLIEHREVKLMESSSILSRLSGRKQKPRHQPNHKALPGLIICLAYKICCGNGGVEFVGAVNQCLTKLEDHSMTMSPCPTLPTWPGTRDRRSQRPRVKPTITS